MLGVDDTFSLHALGDHGSTLSIKLTAHLEHEHEELELGAVHLLLGLLKEDARGGVLGRVRLLHNLGELVELRVGRWLQTLEQAGAFLDNGIAQEVLIRARVTGVSRIAAEGLIRGLADLILA